MRRTVAATLLVIAAVLAVVGCGSSSDYKNDPRPPSPIVLTGSVDDQRVSVSPQRFGAASQALQNLNLMFGRAEGEGIS